MRGALRGTRRKLRGPTARRGLEAPAILRTWSINEQSMSNLLFAIGVIVVIFTGASVLFTIVLPREPKGFQRVSTFVLRVVQLAFIGLSRFGPELRGEGYAAGTDRTGGARGPAGILGGLFHCWIRSHAGEDDP
jgi:hypothetical protein